MSKEWLDLSMQLALPVDYANWYGFYWWLPVLDADAKKRIGPVYVASGWGSRYLIIATQRKPVLVLTGGNYESDPTIKPIVVYMVNELL